MENQVKNVKMTDLEKSEKVLEKIKEHPESASEGLSLLKKLLCRMDDFMKYSDCIEILGNLRDLAKDIKPELFTEFVNTAQFRDRLERDCFFHAHAAIRSMITSHPEAAGEMYESIKNNRSMLAVHFRDFVDADKKFVPEALAFMNTYCKIDDPHALAIGPGGSGRGRLMASIVNADPAYIPQIMKMSEKNVKKVTPEDDDNHFHYANEAAQMSDVICAVVKNDRTMANECLKLWEKMIDKGIGGGSFFNWANECSTHSDKVINKEIDGRSFLSSESVKSTPLTECVKADPRLSSRAFSIVKKCTENIHRDQDDTFLDTRGVLSRSLLEIETIVDVSRNEALKQKAENYKIDLITRAGGRREVMDLAFEKTMTDEQRAGLLERSFQLYESLNNLRFGNDVGDYRVELKDELRHEYGQQLGSYMVETNNLGPKTAQAIKSFCEKNPNVVSKENYEKFKKKTAKTPISYLKKVFSRG